MRDYKKYISSNKTAKRFQSISRLSYLPRLAVAKKRESIKIGGRSRVPEIPEEENTCYSQ